MCRESFVFYRSFYEAIRQLPRDIQGEIYTAIMEYGLNGRETERLKPIARSIFMLIKPQIEANWQRYQNGKKGAVHGSKGGRPAKQQTPPESQSNPNETPNVNANVNANENVNDNVNVNVNVNASAFSPPTLTEVEEYCKERGNRVDAKRFVNFYEAKGWMVGKNKMKSWKAAVRSWEQLERAKPQTKAPNIAQSVNSNRYEQF